MSTTRILFWTVAPLLFAVALAWCLAYVEGGA